MDRALRLARLALESSGDVGLSVSISLIALHYLWTQARTPRQFAR
jgi:hypothetical protein